MEAIRGGDAAHNARALKALLDGTAGPYRDAVLFNAAATLIVAGKASGWAEGAAIAAESLDSGKAGALLEGPYIHRHFNKATPLHSAAAGGHAIVVERLLEASPAMALAKDKGGKTAAYWARRRGYDELGERLGKAEADAKAAGLGKKGTSSRVAPAPPASVKYEVAGAGAE